MKYKKPSKVTQRAIEGGTIPPACGQVKHWKPKRRNWVSVPKDSHIHNHHDDWWQGRMNWVKKN